MADPLSEGAYPDTTEQPAAADADNIAKLFTNIEHYSVASSKNEEISSSESPAYENTTYSADYKPPISEKGKHVYSINELLSLSKKPASESMQSLIDSLPKKKFWRFGRRFSDHTTHKNAGHKNASRSPNSNSKGKVSVGEEISFDRRNSKGKGTRTQHSKKGNKFGKNDRAGYLEEKDIAVNNDDLLALEEDFAPTGNSMADFESWKAKMKEMERKKKGLIEGSMDSHESKTSLSSTSSSISDFLKLNTNNNERGDGLEKKFVSDDMPDKQADNSKGASRFSSFFTQSSSNVSLPSTSSVSYTKEANHSGDTKPSPEGANSGSRLMSFFNNESNKTKENNSAHLPNSIGTQKVAQQFVQKRPLLENRTVTSNPSFPPTQEHSSHSHTNNTFFQGLLNRGKETDTSRPPADMVMPPGLGSVHQSRPPAPSQSPQSQKANKAQQTQQSHHLHQVQPSQQPQPPNQGMMSIPPGFPMGMPPAGFPAPFQGRPQIPPYMLGENQLNFNVQKSPNTNNKANTNHRQNQPPMGVLPQMGSGMAPPGFPPMQHMPPNFNTSIYGPTNGMMQPNGQHFFPPIPPPPGGNMNFAPFQIPGSQKQQGKRQK